MKGLGNQIIPTKMIGCLLLKAQEVSRLLQGKSSLLAESDVSSFEESAAVHYVQLGHLITGDRNEMSDDDSAVVSAVGRLSVVGIDTLDKRTGERSQVCKRDPSPMSIDEALANPKSRFGRWRHWQGKGGTQKLQLHSFG